MKGKVFVEAADIERPQGDPYINLICAILDRALLDAVGEAFIEQGIRRDARRWILRRGKHRGSIEWYAEFLTYGQELLVRMREIVRNDERVRGANWRAKYGGSISWN